MRVLIMTAVAAEKDAVLQGLNGAGGFDVRLAGVGPAAAAANTMRAVTTSPYGYDIVISAGIGGGFPGRAEVGSLVISDELIAADLGAESPDGFLSVDKLGFGTSRIPVDLALAERLADACRGVGLPSQTGVVLTVSTATGTAETARQLTERVPGAAAEAMEGFGVATAASICGISLLEIRAISNAVGPRDRAAWRIPDALRTLTTASRILMEVLS